jgi:hypothetical protein
MVNHINDGWALLSNGTDYLKVFCEHILWTPIVMPEVEHYGGGINFGIDISIFFFQVKLQGVWLDTNTKFENYMTYIKAWQQAGTLKIEIQRNSGGTILKLDGTNTIYPVLAMKGFGEFEKMPGDQDKFRANTIVFEQNGAAST